MTINPFINQTTAGHEKAIKRGAQVPNGAVNLAWAKAPDMTPSNNVIIVDTSRIVDANTLDASVTNLYYANTLGILEDIRGNQLIKDEYPAVTDVFTIEGDLTGVDYSAEHVLSFVHRSKNFHIDWAGLTLGSALTTYTAHNIKVVDGNGNPYLDANGNPRYKIKICPAYRSNALDPSPIQGSSIGNQTAYRIYAYVDTNQNENLYLVYDKIEIATSGALINQFLNYKEILNPQPVFTYRPEEAEVVDPYNREQKWYNTEPISLKEQALGLPVSNVNGFKVFVPKKAINDTRIFQLFRWRVSCAFGEVVNVATQIAPNPTILPPPPPALPVDTSIHVGVIVTNADPTSLVAQVWNKIVVPSINLAGATLTNPLSAGSSVDKANDSYWYVNFDTITNDQLAKFDLLVWSPTAAQFDFTNYIPKIKYFTETLGKKLFIDTENHMVPSNLGITTTGGVSALTSTQSTPGPAGFACAGPRYQIKSNVPNHYAAVQAVNTDFIWQSDQNATTYTGVFYNRIDVTPYPIASPGLVGNLGYSSVSVYTNIAHRFTFFEAVNYHGWSIGDIDAISCIQTDFGSFGGYTQYILTTPSNAVTLVGATIQKPNYLLNIQVNLPSTVNLPTINVNVTTGNAQFFALSSPLISGTSGTLQVTPPAVPSGGIFDRVEIYQDTTFNGSTGNVLTTYLNGSGYLNIPHQGTITGSNTFAEILNADYSLNPAAAGAQVTLSTANTMTYSTASIITKQNLRAQTYYHTEHSTSLVVNIGGNHVSVTLNSPTYSIVPVVTQVGNLIFSTFGILASIMKDLTGAKQFLYNVMMFATANRSLTKSVTTTTNTATNAPSQVPSKFNESTFSSSFSISSPWHLSWVINNNTNVNILTDAEKAKYNFVLQTEDAATPIPVWQRQLTTQTLKEIIDDSLTPEMAKRIAGSVRNYTMEVTNSKVITPSLLTDNTIPHAWTWAYTPQFNIPPDFPAYIIREKEVPGDYEAGQYIARSYPDKPYSCQVTSSYGTNLATTLTGNWTATGTATETYDSSIWTPPQNIQVPTTNTTYRSSTQEIELNWWNNSGRAYSISGLMPFKQTNMPVNLGYWSQYNYYNTSFGNGQLNWPSFNLVGQWAQGSTGDVVRFIQDFLNWYMDLNSSFGVPTGHLAVDGIYGPLTAGAVKDFQIFVGARYIDGIVDAETLSLIGGQIIRYNMHARNGIGFYEWPYDRMQLQGISDGNINPVFMKRSWVTNGPGITWEIFGVQFDTNYAIHGVNFTPYVDGSASTILFEAVDIRPNANLNILTGFNADWMMIKNMNLRVGDNQKTNIPFNPTSGNLVLIGVGQDQTSYPNTSRAFGVREISALATITVQVPVSTTTFVTKTLPGYKTTTTQQRHIYITATGTSTVTTNQPKTFQVTPNYTGAGHLSNINWTSLTIDNANLTGSITGTGMATISNNNTVPTTQTVSGPVIPSPSLAWYSLKEDGSQRPYAESGWISKADGLKLLCQQNGAPFGFPTLPSAAANTTQRNYINLTLTSFGTDPSVQMGFYDINKNEFVIDSQGKPILLYADYMARGPQNIYIGLISTYELDISESLPVYGSKLSTEDAPYIPHLMAMPVYGVTTRPGSKITLEPLAPNLGPQDVWPISVRTGVFNNQVTVPTNVTTYMAPYANTNVTAFYSIPEASLGGWSNLFGRPNVDVVGEQPLIVTDNVIQVRQPPILMANMPTQIPGPADPMVPIFTVYQRANASSPWTTLAWNNIQDYNVSTGEIYLQGVNPSSDPTTYAVDYTSGQSTYPFKQYGGVPLNLNPYPGQSRSLLGQSIYIYIVPQYVTDVNGKVIPASVQTRTLRYTLSPDIFNPQRPQYDPLAIQLGIVFISTTVDLKDLVLLDSRRRGGGAYDGLTAQQLKAIVQEASSYWDIRYGSGMSYQQAGFVIIRLPAQLKSIYDESFIRDVIERNLTAGVQYKLEDLQGGEW